MPRRAVRRLLALVVSVAMLVSLSGNTPAAFASGAEPADDAETAALKDFVDQVGSWTSTLGQVGKLAEPVPLVGASVGGVLGTADLVARTVTASLVGKHDLGDVVGALDGHDTFSTGDGRSYTLRATRETVDDVTTVTFSLDVTVAQTSKPFSFTNDAPRFSLTSSGGVKVGATAHLTFGIGLQHVSATEVTPFLVGDPGVPTLTVDVTGGVSTGATLHAGLGILGVDLMEADDADDIAMHLVGAVDDPDGDGRLYFSKPGGGDGELAGVHSLAGLTTVGFAASGAGSVDLDLAMTATPGGGLTLPAFTAGTHITWPNIAAGTPQATLTGTGSIEDFLRLSPRDLADMLGQLVSVITAAQRNNSENVDLPFLSGSLADAVKAAEGLKAFLTEYVVQPPTDGLGNPVPNGTVDPVEVGQPEFVSLQDLFTKIKAFDGGTTVSDLEMNVSSSGYDATAHRLPFTLTMGRATSGPIDLVEPTIAAAGTAVYADDGFASDAALGADLVGRRVIAGSVGGTIASIADGPGDSRVVTLASPWVGGTPADGTPFTVSGPAVDAGAVNLGNLLSGAGGKAIENANAVLPTATVTPDYDVTLKVALDLSAPRTGAACTDGPDGAACPYQRTNADGSATLIPEEPLPVERLLMGTDYDLLTADFPVTASVDVFAQAGFLGVRLGGEVKACKSSAAADCTGGDAGQHMLTVRVASTGDEPAAAWVPVPAFFRSLIDDPTGRLEASAHVRGYLSGNVSVPDAPTFLGGTGSAGFSATWPDITTGAPTVDVDDLSKILAFDIDGDDPQAMLGVVLRALQLLDEQLASSGGPDVLGAKIPVVDKSLRDFLGSDQSGGGPQVSFGTATVDGVTVSTLTDSSRAATGRAFPAELAGRSVLIGTQVGIVDKVVDNGTTLRLTEQLATPPATGTPYFLRSELADAVSLLQAAPPDSLQELVRILEDRLGSDSPVHFRTADVDAGSGDVQALVLDLDWHKGYDTSAPVSFDIGSLTAAGSRGSGTASVSVDAVVKAGLVVPLDVTSPGDLDLRVLGDSHVSVDAQASVAGDVGVNLGPLSLSLGEPGTDTDAVAKAHYRVGLAGDGDADEAQTLGHFFTGVSPTLNGYDGGVDCGEGAAVPPHEDLALCANFPLYVSANSGGSWSPFLSPVQIRLPKTGSDLFGLAGNVSGADARPRLEGPTPADLEAAFNDFLLDFGVIGEGVDAFLSMVESALYSASLEGKLPVVGGDLQAGADFVGDLRTQLDDLFTQLESVNGGRLPTVDQVEEFLDTKFKAALTAAGANPENFDLALTCQLSAADVTGVAKLGTGTGTTAYTYGVLAVGTFNHADVTTVVGNTVTTAAGPVVDATNGWTVNWDKVGAASGYVVIRSSDGGTTWLEVGRAGAGADTFDDHTAEAAAEAVTVPDQKATLDDCPGVAMIDLQGVVLRTDIGAGTVDGTNGCSGAGCLTQDIPLDVGIPGLSLRAQRDGGGGGLQAKLGWHVHLALSLDRTDGFAVLTKDQKMPEFGVGLSADLDGTVTAELAFLKVTAEKPAGETRPAFAGAVTVDLKADKDEKTCLDVTSNDAVQGCAVDPTARLGLADLNAASGVSDVVSPRLDLNLHVNWLLKATADAALPGIQTRLEMFWVKAFDPQGSHGEGMEIAFRDVAIDAGAFLTDVLGPIVKEIKKVTGPMQPVIDTLYAPIPVLSDLSRLAGGGDVTLVTLAKTFSTLADGPDLKFVDTVAKVIKFVNGLPEPKPGATLLIPIGEFEVSTAQAFDTAVTPDTGRKLIDEDSKKYKKADGSVAASEDEVGLRNSIDERATKKTLAAGSGADAEAAGAGFDFPLLDNPGSVFNLIMGSDIDLVTFDSGPLTLGFTWRQAFGPVYAPPPVFITLSGSASVTAHIVAGFDTYGLRKAFESDFDSPSSVAQILNGLYFKSTDDAGNPLPVVTLYGEIAAGAAVSAVIITVGIEGGVSLTINLAWNDPNNDGKFRLFEFGQVALRNPLCLFQMSGRIALFLRLYITLGFSPFSVSFDFTLADITLLDFSVEPNCDPPPPRLAGKTGADADGKKTLVVFAGKFGKTAQRGDSAWDNSGTESDPVKITALHDFEADPANPSFTGVKVQALGITETFDDPAITRVVVDGRGYDGSLQITMIGDGKQDVSKNTEVIPTGTFDLDTVVIGGSGDDTIKVGRGSAWIDGGGGKDTITADDQPGRTVRVAGGPGDDSIKLGDAGGTVAGDSGLSFGSADQPVTFAGSSDGVALSGVAWSSFDGPTEGETAGSDGNDRVVLGLGSSTAFGNRGDDSVAVSADSKLADIASTPDKDRWRAHPNTLVLGSGSDSAQGGSAADTIWTGQQTEAERGDRDKAAFDDDGVDEPGGDDAGAVRNTVNTGAGNDTVFGSKAVDYVTGGSTASQSDHLRGGGGDDVLIGGLGTDELYAGPGQDWVLAEPSTVSEPTGGDDFGVARDAGHTPLPSGTLPSSKLLVGGDGADHVVGGDGASTLFGDRWEPDACGTPVNTPRSDPPAEPAAGNPGRDLVLGGVGVDKVKAGGDADLVKGFRGADLLCGQAGADVLEAGGDPDLVWGGSGADTAYGDDGADQVFGNDGPDNLWGGAGTDALEGNDGADRASGGTEDDTVVGGTRAAGRTDQGRDLLSGDDGDDVVVGDNAKGVATVYPDDLDGATASAGDGDVASGGPGTDKVYGGLAADVVSGDAGADDLEGNNGADRVFGGDGADDAIGGSSEQVPGSPGTSRPDGADLLRGDAGDDVVAGDNAVLERAVSGTSVTKGRGLTIERLITPLDLGDGAPSDRFGSDDIAGGDANDVLLGQRGDDTLHGDLGDDYAEGGQDADTVYGDAGADDLVGGSFWLRTGDGRTAVGELDGADRLEGGPGGDAVLGDNGLLSRDPAEGISPLTLGDRPVADRAVVPYDLAGSSPSTLRSGGDLVLGEDGIDVVLAQAGDDRVLAGPAADYAEGGPGSDWLEGGDGSDDLVGGSTTIDTGSGDAATGQPDAGDVVWGQGGDDLVTGDNAVVTRAGPFSPLTTRVSEPGTLVDGRSLRLLDLSTGGSLLQTPDAARFGADHLSGQGGVDVLLGQDGADRVSGGGGDDYAEGQGGPDQIWGDSALTDLPVAPPGGSWPGSPAPAYDDNGGASGQDDLMGGSSRPGFRDAADTVHGDEEGDFLLGDNGSVRRRIVADTDAPYAVRYAPDALPANAVKVRISGAGDVSTRFCATRPAGTCEVAGAYGSDSLYGDDGADTAYGQDGDDTAFGGRGDDDLYGELGDDSLAGDAGDDAIVGDRGGVRNVWEAGPGATSSLTSIPKITYTARRAGSVSRVVDLLHDVNGDAFVGQGAAAKMVYDGVVFGDLSPADGTNDRIRGGAGHDSVHAGSGDDLANGDGGGDTVFGGDGADVLWGGKGCDPNEPADQAAADCRAAGGSFDPTARGTDDRMVDYVFGGKGATTGPSTAGKGLGADILDWRPRGSLASCASGAWPVTVGTQSNDPCRWFVMTDMADTDPSNNQHHQGVDWQYGGWDRDVLQGDLADNGPNPGDRLLDWNGAYNLYTHCNSAYGGYNDVRAHSPAIQAFVQQWAYGVGAGQQLSDLTTPGTSAFTEVALAYPSDAKVSSGQAFPSTPGHFDDPNSCEGS